MPTAIRRSVAESVYVEEFGFDDLWVTDLSGQLFGPPDTPQITTGMNAFVYLGAIAAKTNRIRLGIGIIPTPLSHPLDTASKAACLDILSDGRLDLGLGRGLAGIYGPEMLDVLARGGQGSADPSKVPAFREQFFEAVDGVLGVLHNERFNYDGKYYAFKNYTLFPRPIQQTLPVWATASTPSTFPQLGERGVHLMIPLPGWHGGPGWDEMTAAVEAYIESWNAAGHSYRPEIAVRVPTFIHETDDEALALARRTFSLIRDRLIAYARRQAEEGGLSEEEFQSLVKGGAPAEGDAASDVVLTPRPDLVVPESERVVGNVGMESIADESVPIDALVESMSIWGSPETITKQVERIRDKLEATAIMVEPQLMSSTFRADHIRSLQLIADHVMPKFR